MKSLKSAWQLIKETLSNWSDDKAPRMGAALSYCTAFSLAPVLVMVISIAGLVFGRDAAQGRIVGQLEGLLGHDSAAVVQTMLAKASQRGAGAIALVVGFVTLLIGATGVVIELQDAINTVWKVIPKPGRGIRGLIRDRLLSVGLTSIQGLSAEKTPRAPQRMMPAIKTTRATFIRRVRPTGFPPLGPSPARTTPTTRSTVSPSQTREFIGTPYAASSPFARSTSRAYRAIQTFPESTFVA